MKRVRGEKTGRLGGKKLLSEDGEPVKPRKACRIELVEGEPPSKRRGEGGRGGPLPSLHQPLHPSPTVAGPRGRPRASGGMRIF